SSQSTVATTCPTSERKAATPERSHMARKKKQKFVNPRDLPRYMVKFTKGTNTRFRYCYNHTELGTDLMKFGKPGVAAKVYRCSYMGPFCVKWDKKGNAK